MNVRRLLSLLVLPLWRWLPDRPWLCVWARRSIASVRSGTTLIIVPTNFQRRRCPDPGGLLRQNVDTGQVVRIDACIGTDGFLDECVPPGKYRYGLGMPYQCCQTCCKTEFYVELTVGMPVAPDCDARRMPDKPRPMPYAGQVPWANSPAICNYAPPPDAARPDPRPSRDAGVAGDPPVPGTGGTAPPMTGSPGLGSQNTGGCSVGGAGGSTAILVLGTPALMVGFVRASGRRRKTRF